MSVLVTGTAERERPPARKQASGRTSATSAHADPTKAMPGDAAPGLRGTRRLVAVATVLAAMALVVLDAAIANVALPTIAQALHVTPAMSVRVLTAYQTGLVMALLACAGLGESLGYRRVFTAGVAVCRCVGALRVVAVLATGRGGPLSPGTRRCRCRGSRRRAATFHRSASADECGHRFGTLSPSRSRLRPARPLARRFCLSRVGRGSSPLTCRWAWSCCLPPALCPASPVQIAHWTCGAWR